MTYGLMKRPSANVDFPGGTVRAQDEDLPTELECQESVFPHADLWEGPRRRLELLQSTADFRQALVNAARTLILADLLNVPLAGGIANAHPPGEVFVRCVGQFPVCPQIVEPLPQDAVAVKRLVVAAREKGPLLRCPDVEMPAVAGLLKAFPAGLLALRSQGREDVGVPQIREDTMEGEALTGLGIDWRTEVHLPMDVHPACEVVVQRPLHRRRAELDTQILLLLRFPVTPACPQCLWTGRTRGPIREGGVEEVPVVGEQEARASQTHLAAVRVRHLLRSQRQWTVRCRPCRCVCTVCVTGLCFLRARAAGCSNGRGKGADPLLPHVVTHKGNAAGSSAGTQRLHVRLALGDKVRHLSLAPRNGAAWEARALS